MKRAIVMAALLMASNCWAQEQAPGSQQAPSTQQLPRPAQEQSPTAAAQEPFIIPAGTRIPLTLTSPIETRTARPGDSVRALTSFPVTIGTQVMIPPGTYVQGTLEKVIKRNSYGYPALQIRFTHIVFVNGYAVLLEGEMAKMRDGNSGAILPESSAAERQGVEGFAFGGRLGFQQQPPTLPPLPQLGPSPAKVAGIAGGVTAAIVVTLILVGRHRGVDGLFDAGWQFEMILQSPLSLDADKVTEAIAGPVVR
jgi:hypothetical protein